MDRYDQNGHGQIARLRDNCVNDNSVFRKLSNNIQNLVVQ